MFYRAMAIGLLGSRKANALKEPYLLVYLGTYLREVKLGTQSFDNSEEDIGDPDIMPAR